MPKSLVLLAVLLSLAPATAPAQALRAGSPQASAADSVLSAAEASKLMPATVFFKGQTASIQARNSAGIKTAAGKLMLVALVDTSGYASGVAKKYQGYLLSEIAIELGGKTLRAGAYGFGFLSNGTFNVMDIGGNNVLTVPSARDRGIKRPVPLKITIGHEFRLYCGKNFVQFKAR